MSVTIDYIRTRAAGLKSHLFTKREYQELIHISELNDFIEAVKSKSYESQLSTYFTTSDLISSFAKSIFLTVDDRWKKITSRAENSLKNEIDIYKRFIDIRNLVTIVNRIEADSGLVKTDIFSLIFPGGSISFHTWNELRKSSDKSELLSKTEILAPQLAKVKSFLNFNKTDSIQFSIDLISLINYLLIGEKVEDKEYIIPKSPTSIILVDLVNKTLLRICIREDLITSEYRKKIYDVLQPWVDLDTFIGSMIFDIEPKFWYRECQKEILTKLKKYGIEDATEEINDQIVYMENYISQLTLESLRKEKKFSLDQFYDIFLVLLSIITEGKNLIWICFSITNRLSVETIKRRLVL